MEKLHAESTILDFTPLGEPAEAYLIRFHGKGAYRPSGSNRIHTRDLHEVSIKLGASYPRMMPELQWKSPIFHPNISGGGVVCLGGYGTHWVPSLNLDELCVMLWDMIRYQNYDVESPYNREAALWAKTQTDFRFPLDRRPLRDKLANAAPVSPPRREARDETSPPLPASQRPARAAEVVFIDTGQIIDAEVLDGGDSDIMFIE
ncbi:MAG: ubiquitin-conjugating enzyme E2 [Planctomycetes bacterium]|nr:ubiquitin-conjugating enzyme E2 [Planctomycetota bacterium]